ncbi:MAG: LysM peptidoglycan-binding domain-containing protein [Thermodesulfobacteriota bacterium]
MKIKSMGIGMILLLLSSCFPHFNLSSNQNPTEPRSPLLFTQSELEKIFSYDPIPMEPSQPLLTSLEILNIQGLVLPISDEASDDFILEPHLGDPGRRKKDFDIPIVINAKVEQFIQYFQTTGRTQFANWLSRSERYIPFMANVLKENGLPEDLVYMAMIESGFNPYAYSRSKASGPWQFIYLTGKKYGLKVNWWVDERRDPEKSTIAAAKYLKDLYDMFECWYLAAAGYNAGEKKIAKAMKLYRTEDFWELTKYRYLKQETKDYVPQMIAAALIAKDPEKYGFTEIEYEEPFRYEKVIVPPATDLQLIAKACEISLEELKDLNPELLRWCTPPDDPAYEIKIPLGKKEIFLKNFPLLEPEKKRGFKTHIVKRGDTIQKIAKLYKVEVTPILELNRLDKRCRLMLGMNLLIPIPKESEPQPALTQNTSFKKGSVSIKDKEIIYTIKKGDTLWSIANEMGVNIGALSRDNKIGSEKKLIPGAQLKIRLDQDSTEVFQNGNGGKELIYVVRKGDTLWEIAKKYRLSVSEIKRWNGLDGSDRIYPEDKLNLKIKENHQSLPN